MERGKETKQIGLWSWLGVGIGRILLTGHIPVSIVSNFLVSKIGVKVGFFLTTTHQNGDCLQKSGSSTHTTVI